MKLDVIFDDSQRDEFLFDILHVALDVKEFKLEAELEQQTICIISRAWDFKLDLMFDMQNNKVSIKAYHVTKKYPILFTATQILSYEWLRYERRILDLCMRALLSMNHRNNVIVSYYSNPLTMVVNAYDSNHGNKVTVAALEFRDDQLVELKFSSDNIDQQRPLRLKPITCIAELRTYIDAIT
jgi:hypothetical protein